MKKSFCKILCFVTMACFVLIFVQEKWRPFELKPLAGVNFTTEFPAFTMENYTTRNLQRDLEQYSKENFAGVIRVPNQVKFIKREIILGEVHLIQQTCYLKKESLEI